MAWTLSGVRASGEGYCRELGRARVARLAGRPAPSPEEIREAYAHELGRPAIDVALELAETASPDSADALSGRALLAWLVALEVERVCAPMDHWLEQWWESAVVRTADARVVPLREVDRAIAREPDRAMRLQLDAARVELIERDAAPTLMERAARERDAIEQLGLAGTMREVAERLTGDDPGGLADGARDALARSADAWLDSLTDRLRSEHGIARPQARPADVMAAIDASLWDGAFRASGREAQARRMVTEMGFSPDLGGRLRIDMTTRARGSGAECIPVEVPGAVHVAFGAEGGVAAESSALRALGCALRLTHVQGDAPFEHRWLGDPSLLEMCGRALASVLVDEGWLMRYADLSRSEARRLVRTTALGALHELRHACALHIHYVESVDATLAVGAQRELYAEIVGSALGVRPHGADSLLDAPPVLVPGARLRGMQAAGVLSDELVERFDQDWYRNPRTGPWLTQAVLAPGCGETAAQMIRTATGRELSFAACVARLERALAA